MTKLEKGMSIIKLFIIIFLSAICVGNSIAVWFTWSCLFISLCIFIFEIWEFWLE